MAPMYRLTWCSGPNRKWRGVLEHSLLCSGCHAFVWSLCPEVAAWSFLKMPNQQELATDSEPGKRHLWLQREVAMSTNMSMQPCACLVLFCQGLL